MNTMQQTSQTLQKELSEIKEKLTRIHTDLTQHITTTHSHPETLLQLLQKNLTQNLITYLTSETERQLTNNMVKNCKMYEECKNNFKNLLSEHATLLNKKTVTKNEINEKYQLLETLEKTAPYPQCTACFNEAKDLLNRQTQLIKTTNYQEANEELPPIQQLPTKQLVKQILEPIAHPQRLEILKALYYEPKTFSQLSQHTKLRGGNLLFHLQKLTNAQLITQKNERSNYQITKKGEKILKTLQQLHTNKKV